MPSYSNQADRYQLDIAEVTDYRSLLVRYLRYWPLFLLGLVLALAGAFLYISYSPPQYNVSSSLLIKEEAKSSDAAKSALFNDLGILNTSKNIDNEIIILKSSSLMLRVLTELSLNSSFYKKGWARDQELYKDAVPFKLVIHSLDSTSFKKTLVLKAKNDNSFELRDSLKSEIYQFGQVIKTSYGTFTVLASPVGVASIVGVPILVRFHDTQKIVNDYVKKLRVNPVNKQATVLTISITDAVPEKGKDIINKLMEVYNKEAEEDKNLVASNTISFIDTRLISLRTELNTVERGVEEFKQKNQVADVNSQINQSLQEASGYNKQVAEAAIQIEVLESIENYINKEGSLQQLIPSALSVQDPTLSGLIAKFNELQLDRERMLRTASPSNPFVQNMSEQLANLRLNILGNLKTTKNSLVITRRNLLAKSAQFTSRIQQVPTIERELLGINRQQEIKNSLYLYLLQKREESALSLAATVSNSRVLDAATADENPISPKKPVILLIALIAGLGLPFAGIYLKEILNNKVQSLSEVEQTTTAPILGELLHNESGKDLVIAKENRSPLAEMFRLIRTNLQFTTGSKENQVTMVTSSMSGEGKSFFCLNLGATLSLTGKRVIVINLDLRKPPLTPDPRLGLTDYLLSNEVSIDDIVLPYPAIHDLYMINTGPLPINPAEAMMSPKILQLLTMLRENFDHIIIDTAPVGQVADAFTLSSYADSTIYLVRYNFTFKSQLPLINKIHGGNRFNNLMLVLNDAPKNDVNGYGYGYGPTESENKKQGKFSFR